MNAPAGWPSAPVNAVTASIMQSIAPAMKGVDRGNVRWITRVV
jgi:hypothetical protein